MSWQPALRALAGIGVTGVTSSYDLDEVPSQLPAADLPALVPQFPAVTGLRGEEDRGLASLTYDGSAWVSSLQVDHVLYWTPAWADMGLMVILPDLLDAVDDYLDAVSADSTLNGTLQESLVVERVQVGRSDRGGVTYCGVRFRHVWTRVFEKAA